MLPFLGNTFPMSDIYNTFLAPQGAPSTAETPLSITALSQRIQNVITQNFSNIYLRGEISGLKKHTSGHIYFTLKDSQNTLNAICWRGTASKLKFLPEEGLDVICKGRVTTYPARSQYQFIVESLEPAGQGALLQLLEERKKKLAAEGLFNQEHKKPLPRYPQKIGVITSETGAVIQDILHRLEARYPTTVQLYPVLVQGEKAAVQIIQALQYFNTMADRPDVLIVARGGGSLEDLWPFNDEALVRTVYASNIPVISAVGHETDTTLIDYVADQRAPTPTGAAEMAVPVRADLLAMLHDMQTRLYAQTQRGLSQRAQIVSSYRARGLGVQEMIETKQQRLDERQQRLSIYIEKHFQEQHFKLDKQKNALNSFMQRYLPQQQSMFQNKADVLQALSPTSILARGYTLVRQESKYIGKKENLRNEAPVEIIFQDGTLTTTDFQPKA